MTYAQCQLAAAKIVARYRALLPPHLEMRAGGGGKGEVDTRFSRKGTSSNVQNMNLPDNLASLIENNALYSAPSATLNNESGNFLGGLLSRDQGAVPGASTLQGAMAWNPTGFDGRSSLTTMAGRNPFSSQFEKDTAGAYQRRAADAMAQAQTGQESVRGGASRPGIMQGVLSERLAEGRGDEVRRQQIAESGIVQGAATNLNQMEAIRRSLGLQAQGQLAGQQQGREGTGIQSAQVVNLLRQIHQQASDLAGRMRGSAVATNNDNLSGRGMQTSWNSYWNLLGGLCFIFMEAENEQLPIEFWKDKEDWQTEDLKRGYLWMAVRLVPGMQAGKGLKRAVRLFITQPMLAYARWRYGTGRWGWLGAPVRLFWTTVWTLIGRVVKETEVKHA